ncbi:MAG TPA: RNB domain-containing ribonuclease [bacterium]|nr:RNB domain-containing ribonuclease [bacterium]
MEAISPSGKHGILLDIAVKAMKDRGFEPGFPTQALKQLEEIHEPSGAEVGPLKDMTGLLWCSIDNDDSKDLDQLSVGEKLPDGRVKVYVAVADVDALVKRGTPLDQHAQKNTTSVYTGIKTFPMLPEKLSTDLTSLNENQKRVALVVEMTVDGEGRVAESAVYRAWVENKAQLTYNAVGAWLEDKRPLPPAAARVPGMDTQLKLQDDAAQRLRNLRHEHGALELETLQPRPVTKDGEVIDLALEFKNRAGELIEDFMIAANGITARFLTQAGFPTLRRVVRIPKRWDKIVSVAEGLGEKLPGEPDSKALNDFLARQRKKDPLRFPDLSLTVVKLLGRGEYVPEAPGDKPLGHFGLAVRDYNHSTAPNRRYPDLITHRLLKAALAKAPTPYSREELSSLAAHCTAQEDAADKVERQVRKSASALFLSKRIGEYFEAIVTGASDKGIWVRLLKPAVEGKLVQGAHGLDVGDRLRVKLIEVNVEQGWIDFANAGRH